MFIIKRNQVIVTALVAMVAVAGYLNFTETQFSNNIVENAMILNEEGDNLISLIPDGEIRMIADDEDLDYDFSVADIEFKDPLDAEAATLANARAEEDDTGAAIFVNSNENVSSSVQFFAQAKLEREQSRAKEKEILTEMINNENVDSEKKAECADNMLEIQKRIEKETSAEAMIKSKGFNECYVRIDSQTVDVVVDKETLTDAEIAQIMDIVTRKAETTADKIRISPLKK